MLVIHSSSECDICLNTYTWENSAQSPYAIPCGHTFCKTCLDAIRPSNCPLCRRPYRPNRAHKIHVDPLEAVGEERGLDLLHQLSLAWEEKFPAEDLAVIAGEIEAWLRSCPKDPSTPLCKVRDTLTRYQDAGHRWERDRQTISGLETALQKSTERVFQEQDTSRATKASLLVQLDDLMAKQAKLESEVTSLRVALRESRHDAKQVLRLTAPIPQARTPSSTPKKVIASQPTPAAIPATSCNSGSQPAHPNSNTTRASKTISYPTRSPGVEHIIHKLIYLQSRPPGSAYSEPGGAPERVEKVTSMKSLTGASPVSNVEAPASASHETLSEHGSTPPKGNMRSQMGLHFTQRIENETGSAVVGNPPWRPSDLRKSGWRSRCTVKDGRIEVPVTKPLPPTTTGETRKFPICACSICKRAAAAINPQQVTHNSVIKGAGHKVSTSLATDTTQLVGVDNPPTCCCRICKRVSGSVLGETSRTSPVPSI